jgi:hypothetical protein
MNKPLGAHYLGLSPDQGNAEGQLLRGMCLSEGIGVRMNPSSLCSISDRQPITGIQLVSAAMGIVLCMAWVFR